MDAPSPDRRGAAAREAAPRVVILAAGLGQRMKSDVPKVLHELMGRPLLFHVLNSVRYLRPPKIVVVVGHGAAAVRERVAEAFPGSVDGSGKGFSEGSAKGALRIVFAPQDKPLGSGHAVLAAEKALAQARGPLLILPGDAPLVSPQTLLDLGAAHRELGASLSVLTARLPDPAAYGRIVRDSNGWLARIVEYKDATEEERKSDEINSGVYLGDAREIFKALKSLRPANVQNEYYLTDIVESFRAKGLRVAGVEGPDPSEIQGVNDRADLARAREILRRKINESWLKAGVTILDPQTVTIEPTVKLERDVIVGPGAILAGYTKVGAGTRIGAYATLADARIGARCAIGSHVVLAGATVPPGARLRSPPPQMAPAGRLRVPRPPRGAGKGF
ncbi:MAG: NTP transferase domain-containing protein [Deltaproteobacteria bacterium]|jgi:bifunctional UDP-N-acetylglucosamine pyrophosphorylase/glucosamine-1-phosphate N-acetyltransferase|nr:NTP transferase domain-containing protein [Deltaproteobacteria bacterium]